MLKKSWIFLCLLAGERKHSLPHYKIQGGKCRRNTQNPGVSWQSPRQAGEANIAVSTLAWARGLRHRFPFFVRCPEGTGLSRSS